MTEEGASEKLAEMSEQLICLRSSLPKPSDCGCHGKSSPAKVAGAQRIPREAGMR
jgi:hypothetical protein